MNLPDLIREYIAMAIGGAIFVAFIYLLNKLKWYHFLFIPLFVSGIFASAFLAYIVGWPLFEYLELTNTNWVFLPMLIGGFVWSFFWIGFYLYDKYSSNKVLG